jgi:hypothetical protein
MANCAPASAIICGQPGRTLRPVIITTSIFVCGDLAGGGTVESTLLFHRCPPAEQVGQLRDVGGDAPGLIAVDQSGISDSALVGALGAGASCAGRGRGIGNAAAPRW